MSRYHSSQPDRWVVPRRTLDPSERLRAHGPVRPMETPGLLARIFRRER